MLGRWLPHEKYREQTLLKLVVHIYFDRNRVLQMERAILKLLHLILDKSLSIIKPLYSNTVAPANEQNEIIRSLVLMLALKYQSITEWAEVVANDHLYYNICGFIERTPLASSY